MRLAVLLGQHRAEPPLGFQPHNMQAYFAGFRFGSGMASLAHMQERLAAIADVTVFENPRQNTPRSMRQDSDFSHRMVAEMADDSQFSEFQLNHGTKLDAVRMTTAIASNDTLHQDDMIDLLESTRGRALDIILRSDGYTATIMKQDAVAAEAAGDRRQTVSA